jgi:hypothetical protein
MRPQLALLRHTGGRAVCLRLTAPLSAVLMLAGCTSASSADHDLHQHIPAHSTSPTKAADGAPLQRAQLLLAEYDYAGAAAALAKQSGAPAQAMLVRIAAAKARSRVWADDTTISHIFYHSLVVDPQRAFRSDTQGVGFSQYMVTLHEFTAQ